MIPVVTTQWIVHSVKRNKQAQVRPYSPDPRMIFSEVVMTCAGLPQMDTESIIGATMALGGQESKDIGRPTTHVCALDFGDERIQIAIRKGWKGKVVLPHWCVSDPIIASSFLHAMYLQHSLGLMLASNWAREYLRSLTSCQIPRYSRSRQRTILRYPQTRTWSMPRHPILSGFRHHRTSIRHDRPRRCSKTSEFFCRGTCPFTNVSRAP